MPALDRLRAAALVLMLVHHFTKWLGGDPRTVIPGWEGFVVTDLAAPAFTIAAGASAVLWASGRHRVSPWTVVRRYGLLVPTGMLLQWLLTSHVPFDWGVLQALGVGVVLSTLVAMTSRSPVAVGACAAAALVAGPIIEASAEGWAPGRWTDAMGGVFPAVTYAGFALAGACGGLVLRRNPERGMQALALGGVLTVATLVLLEAGMPPDRYPGGAAFVIPGLAGTLLLFGVLDRWSVMPAAFGNHSLGIFISHYAVFWVLARWGLRDSMETETALVVAFGAVLAFALVAPRVPKLPWSPRTGWARGRRPALTGAR